MKLEDECIICLENNLKWYEYHTNKCCGSTIHIHRVCLKEWNKKENKCIICSKENIKFYYPIFKRIKNSLHFLGCI
jgi:hypothetical protein